MYGSPRDPARAHPPAGSSQGVHSNQRPARGRSPTEQLGRRLLGSHLFHGAEPIRPPPTSALCAHPENAQNPDRDVTGGAGERRDVTSQTGGAEPGREGGWGGGGGRVGRGRGEETEEAVSNCTTPLPALFRCPSRRPPRPAARLPPRSRGLSSCRTIAAGSMTLSLRAENPRWLPVDFSSPVAPACPLTCAWWPSPPTT